MFSKVSKLLLLAEALAVVPHVFVNVQAICCIRPSGTCFNGDCEMPNIPYTCCQTNGKCCPQQTLEERALWHRETLMKLTALDDKDGE